tara:strand:- start:417 stop:674 length:258 start_codon:yes stop_codon:yes gene_type:complete
MQKVSTFEVVLLIASITTTILGFHLINQMFLREGELGWMMVIAIFNWLMLLVLFVSLSLTVDATKKQLHETRHLVHVLTQKKSKK